MRTPGPKKAGAVMILWLMAGVFFAPRMVSGQTTCAQEVADIQAYCKRIDRYIKANQTNARVFARTSSSADHLSDGWLEIKTEIQRSRADDGEDLPESAHVWLSQGRVVSAS